MHLQKNSLKNTHNTRAQQTYHSMCCSYFAALFAFVYNNKVHQCLKGDAHFQVFHEASAQAAFTNTMYCQEPHCTWIVRSIANIYWESYLSYYHSAIFIPYLPPIFNTQRAWLRFHPSAQLIFTSSICQCICLTSIHVWAETERRWLTYRTTTVTEPNSSDWCWVTSHT